MASLTPSSVHFTGHMLHRKLFRCTDVYLVFRIVGKHTVLHLVPIPAEMEQRGWLVIPRPDNSAEMDRWRAVLIPRPDNSAEMDHWRAVLIPQPDNSAEMEQQGWLVIPRPDNSEEMDRWRAVLIP